MGRRVYLGGAGTPAVWYDITPWVAIFPTEEQLNASGMSGKLDIEVLGQRRIGGAMTPLPVLPSGGHELVYMDQNANPALHVYYFAGKLADRVEVDLPEGKGYRLTFSDFGRELKAHIPYIEFDSTVYPNDKVRVQALFNTAVAQGWLRGEWDVSTGVQGPFVTFASGEAGRRKYVRKSMRAILAEMSAEPGQSSDAGYPVPYRRWHISGVWRDPSNPGGPGNAIKRVLNYYGMGQVSREVVPLTDRADGMAYWARDTFDRADSGTTLGRSDSYHDWQVVNGTFGISANRAYVVGASGEAVAVIDAGVADCELYVTFAVLGTHQRLVFRVTVGGAGGWQGWMLQKGSLDDYGLYRYEGGTAVQVGPIVAGAANGDVMKVVLAGSLIRVYRNGGEVPIIEVSDGFNAGATRCGLGGSGSTPSSARWDNFEVRARGNKYQYNWDRNVDFTDVVNAIPIEGPVADPAEVSWGAQAGVSAGPGKITKTAVGDNWDAGAVSEQVITDDGGAVWAAIEHHPLVQDSFSRVSPYELGEAETGQEWEELSGDWVIYDNAAALYSTPGTHYAVVDAKASTCIVQARLSTYAGGAMLAFRFSDVNNGWLIKAVGTGTTGYALYRRQGGVNSFVSQYNCTPTSGDILKVSLEGNNIKFYLRQAGEGDFALRLTHTDSFNAGATKHGIGGNAGEGANNARWDDFNVWQTYARRAFGLTHQTGCTSYTQLEFGVYLDEARNAKKVEAGEILSIDVRTYTEGERYRVQVRPEVVGGQVVPVCRWYYMEAGGTQWVQWGERSLSTPNYTEAAPGRLGVGVYHAGGSLASVMVQRFTYGLYQDDASVGEYGYYWGELVKDDNLDTEAKRRAHARSIFARHAMPRDTMTVNTLAGYAQGRLVLVDNVDLGWIARPRLISEVKRNWGYYRNARYPLYTLTLGDAPVEYGDEEPLGFLLEGRPDDGEAPPVPTGFAATTGVRESRNTVAQRFRWDRVTHDEQWIEIRVARVEDPQNWRVERFVVTPEGVFPRLEPGRRYLAQARARDANGNTSDWTTPAVQFQAMLVPLPLPPKALAASSVWSYERGGAVTTFTWQPPPGQSYNEYELTVTVGGVTTVHRVRNALMLVLVLGGGLSGQVTAASVDDYGLVGNPSSPVGFVTAQPELRNELYNPSFEVLDPGGSGFADGWMAETTGNAGVAMSTAAPAEGVRCVRISSPDTASEGAVWSRRVAVRQGQGYVVQVLAYAEMQLGFGLDYVVRGKVRWYDKNGNLLSTSTAFDSGQQGYVGDYVPWRGMATAPNGAVSASVGVSALRGANTVAQYINLDAVVFSGGMEQGSAFPQNAPAGALYTHTGYGGIYRYNGTYWLSAPYTITLIFEDGRASGPYTASAVIYGGAIPADARLWLERVTWACSVGTKNDATNYWTLRLGYRPVGSGGGSVLLDLDTRPQGGEAVGDRIRREGSSGFAANPLDPASALSLFVEVQKVGGPGPLSLYGVTLKVREARQA